MSGTIGHARQRQLSARLGFAAAFLVSALFLLWPSQASAQIPPATVG
jgi:hypothetical protein